MMQGRMPGDPVSTTVEAPRGEGVAAPETRRTPSVSVVIPCLDEAQSIQECVSRARRALDGSGFRGEVIVADNGSTDGSPKLAAAAGAKVVHERRRGYGSAYL